MGAAVATAAAIRRAGYVGALHSPQPPSLRGLYGMKGGRPIDDIPLRRRPGRDDGKSARQSGSAGNVLASREHARGADSPFTSSYLQPSFTFGLSPGSACPAIGERVPIDGLKPFCSLRAV